MLLVVNRSCYTSSAPLLLPCRCIYPLFYFFVTTSTPCSSDLHIYYPENQIAARGPSAPPHRSCCRNCTEVPHDAEAALKLYTSLKLHQSFARRRSCTGVLHDTVIIVNLLPKACYLKTRCCSPVAATKESGYLPSRCPRETKCILPLKNELDRNPRNPLNLQEGG